MKKIVLILIILIVFTGIVYSQGISEVPSETSEKTQVFVDDLGREVILPAEITRIAPSGSNAQVIVFQIAPEKLVGLASKLSGDELTIYPSFTHNLPAFGTLYGKKANLNKETLILANPELIIDVGDIKGSVEEMAKELDVPREDVVFALEAIQDPISLFEPVYNDGGDAIYIMDQVRDDSHVDENWLEHIAIKEAMRRLNEREKKILRLRFFEGRTQMEVAGEIGISQAQVSRLEKNALLHMRKYVAG